MNSPASLPPLTPTPSHQTTHLLEINLISAQNLKPPSTNLRRLQTYAVAYIDASRKLRSRVDRIGGENPSWNDKFIFRVSDEFLASDTSSFTVDIFAVGVLKDALLGSVRFLLSNCVSLHSVGVPSFVAVQIRRSSGRFHGILNVGAMVIDALSELGFSLAGVSAIGYRDFMGETHHRRRRNHHRRGVSDLSSGSESCGGDSVDYSDESESTASNSSTASASNVLKELNGRREMAGKSKGEGGMILCGLGFQKKIHFSPDQDIEALDALDLETGR
ncbi:BON1-associated protein 2-like [Chenopodium quinoa]|uniref:BON1-associated protein 2-like n=1 Tax=Chenopodium quinoa TaxID=63459 RepID=UPI000B779BF7|nr:BON1-associated protein 2-like [Chenopodium quinoa]